ncbi:histidinol dehydrogenase [Thermopetrobacter sp. TC1]|uniref:histidinol dehydrogenase n=1 Tax=Thermopetrobacter sp. TC1 TaxID=1495045 RepID=UPI000570A031|nr:histidinol dehydrogenase [Thermopetrobacter sp. TC1]
MARLLNTRDPGFQSAFTALLRDRNEAVADVADTVRAIIDDVRRRGDEALHEYTTRFDGFDSRSAGLRITAEEIAQARARIDPEVLEALALAAERIRAYHERQMPDDELWTDAIGARLGHKWTPVSAAGLYVPGGLAAYPSSVLMNAIPAKVAGVDRLAMAVPTPKGAVNDLVLAAADLAGVDEVWRIGGAQAIAALAYGTESIAPVDIIVGPGNAFVAEAKRQVFGQVGIDMIAGPSEVLIIADGSADPAWLAADLLAQAEHDEKAQSILITPDADLAREVLDAVTAQLADLPKRDIAGKSWQDHGAVIVVRDLDEAVALANRVAPEHLELEVAEPEALLADIRNAGAIFLGGYTPEAVGDYVAGPNHVLPTSGSARFSSGLNVLQFMKRTTILGCSREALNAIGPAAVKLAEAEGLEAHARSVRMRLNKEA